MTEITRDHLMAYADRQLPPEQYAEVEAYLQQNPDMATEVALMQRQSDAIRTLYGPVANEPVPSRLDPHRLAIRASRQRWQGVGRLAGIAAVLVLGIGLGWSLRLAAPGQSLSDRLIAEAASAHTVYAAETRHAVEVAGNESEHLSTWLSNRLDTSLAMPDLTTAGLTFMGGRLLPAPDVPGGRAAQLMYEDAAGTRLTLFITPATGSNDPNYQLANLDGDMALYWSNDVLTCTIIGAQPKEQLQSIARTVFSQLSPAPKASDAPYTL
jgi:anti-sigma factor RsiW